MSEQKIINSIQKYFDSKIKKIEQLQGGVTNVIYKVYTDSNVQIIRFYGDKSDMFIDRKIEKKIMNYLCKYNISPEIIKEYNNCRIEQYFEGKNNIHPSKYQEQLCKTLKKIHILPIKENLPYFWDRFYKWKQESGNPYQEEINDIINLIKSFNANYWNQEVLGHGDLTIGNILFNKGIIRLIDYEYSCILPRAFDIANHLCEYEGLESEKLTYPDKNLRISLIKEYIKGEIDYDDNFLRIIDYYSLISHYYWGCWSIIQTKLSLIDFDYKKYGDNRFKMFIYYKNILEKY
jgi:ethanolamine kinase